MSPRSDWLASVLDQTCVMFVKPSVGNRVMWTKIEHDDDVL